jgi:hypothetical protein
MKTVILTGVWNTGKDYAAAMLQDLGVMMKFGVRDDATFDDSELAYLFSHHPQTIPVDIIRQRDARGFDWGTKLGEFWNCCAPTSVGQIFTSPHVIIMQRDLAVVHEESGHSLEEIAEEVTRSLHWARRLTCPVMHLSSETMFRNREGAMASVRDFIGRAGAENFSIRELL